MMMYDNSPFNCDNNLNNFNFSYDQDYEREQRIVAFLDKIKYPSIQENGQKKLGPPPDWQGDPPPKGCEVFVGHLPRDIREDVIFPIFARIGKIYELRLMMDFSGSNRGYGFVMYTNAQDAEKAVRELNNFQMCPGKKIGVVISKDNCRLFVGKIPRNVSRQEIFVELARHTEQVVDVIVHQDHEHPHLNRGYAFIEYASHKAAAMARRHLLPAKVKLFGVETQVDWADPESEVDHATMARVTNLYVRNIHANVGEEELKMLFSSLDHHLLVVRVKKVKDFAFIHFNSRPEAERALSLATASPVFGFQLSANGQGLEVKWAKPPEAAKKDGRRKGFNNQNRYQQQSPEPQPQYKRSFVYQNDRTRFSRFNEMQSRSFQSTNYPVQGSQTKSLLSNFQAGGDIRHLSSSMIPSPVPFLCRSPPLLLSSPSPTGFVVQQNGYAHFNSTVGKNNNNNPFQMGLNLDCFAN